MKLVRFDLIHERWTVYEIDDREAVFHGNSFLGTTTLREPRTWRYEYKLGANGRVTTCTGIAAICHTEPVARMKIRQFLKAESWKDIA